MSAKRGTDVRLYRAIRDAQREAANLTDKVTGEPYRATLETIGCLVAERLGRDVPYGVRTVHGWLHDTDWSKVEEAVDLDIMREAMAGTDHDPEKALATTEVMRRQAEVSGLDLTSRSAVVVAVGFDLIQAGAEAFGRRLTNAEIANEFDVTPEALSKARQRQRD